jgi:hypothetical protein
MKSVGNFLLSVWLILEGLSGVIMPTDEGKINFFFAIPRFSLLKGVFPYLGLLAGAIILVQTINDIKNNRPMFLVALWAIAICVAELVGLLNTPFVYAVHLLGMGAGYFLLKEWQQAQKVSQVVGEK